jgi:hypothetical protein
MKISDRDKNLILFVLLAAIIALPIVFFIKPKKEDITALDNELVSLNERYTYLKALYEKKPFYESEIERLSKERDEIIKGFAQGIKQENTIMFLRNIELTFPIYMSSEQYSDYAYTTVAEGSYNENGELEGDLTAMQSDVVVSYYCEYDQFKQLLDYIFNYKDKIAISAISARYNTETGYLEGTFNLSEYAIIGTGRSVATVPIPELKRGENEAIFYPYDYFVEEEEEVVEEEASAEEAEEETEATE